MLKCEHIENPKHNRYYYYPDGTAAGFLCDDCAHSDGFCPMCGSFVGGVEADMVSMREWGMCYDCQNELDALLDEIEQE